MAKLSLEWRLKCPHSYADEEHKDLMCAIGDKVCDGTYYMDCQPDTCIYGRGVCCYPIDECDECPAHPKYRDTFMEISKCRIS